MVKVPWWGLAACVAVGFAGGAFVSSAWNAEQRGRAEEIERQATALRERVRADSVRMADMRGAYEDSVATGLARIAALTEAEARTAAEARRLRAERTVLVAHADSLDALLTDTTTMVPRATYDAARVALAAAIEEAKAAAAQLAPITADRDAWKALWAQADTGWAEERLHVVGMNEALAAQVRATDAWRKAAKPSLGVRALRALPPLAVGGALCYAFCPAR